MLEILLLSSFSSPVRVLNKIYPFFFFFEEGFYSALSWWKCYLTVLLMMKLYIWNVWVIKFLSICIDLILSLWSETHLSVKKFKHFKNISCQFLSFSEKEERIWLGMIPTRASFRLVSLFSGLPVQYTWMSTLSLMNVLGCSDMSHGGFGNFSV